MTESKVPRRTLAQRFETQHVVHQTHSSVGLDGEEQTTQISHASWEATCEYLAEETSKEVEDLRERVAKLEKRVQAAFPLENSLDASLSAHVERWGRHMLQKLVARKSRGTSWLETEPGYLFARLRNEFAELEDAYRNNDMAAVRAEAADVANMAMMVADALFIDRQGDLDE